MPLDLSKLTSFDPVDKTDALTSSDEIASRYLDQITGKTVVITGVSPGGIGAATALSLATGSPKLLVLAGRSLSKVNETIADVKAVNQAVETRALELDLNSLSQVTQAAKSLSDLPCIDILINNAGIMAPPFSKSVDGFESQFATNHLGHFQLTRILLPQLQASKDGGRVVDVTSNGHALGPIRWDDYNFDDGKTYDKWDAYGQSKTANILHALALKKNGLVKNAFAVHPGAVQTHLLKEHAQSDIEGLMENWSVKFKTPKQGASTVVRAALDPSLHEFAYMEDCQVSKALSHATDPELADRLWKISEELIDAKL